MNVNVIEIQGIMTKSNLPLGDFSVNPYVGCAFACKYCYASFMKRFTGHDEPWGDFVDVKEWPSIKTPANTRERRPSSGRSTTPTLRVGAKWHADSDIARATIRLSENHRPEQ